MSNSSRSNTGANQSSSVFNSGSSKLPGFSAVQETTQGSQPQDNLSVQDLSQALASLPPQASQSLLQDGLSNGLMGPDNASDKSIEKEVKLRQMRMKRHQELQGVEVYNSKQAETDRQIKQILEELKALTKDLDTVHEEAKDAQSLVISGNIAVGTGSISFLKKLIHVIMLLRARVKKSRIWLNQLQSKKSKKKYWNMALGKNKGQGMQWAMSSERSAGEQM